MEKEIYSFALKTALTEIQSACPEVKGTFMFQEDGEIIAGDEKTPENVVVHAINAFDGIFEKANTIGDIESLTFESSKGRVHVYRIDDLYLATITSEKADTNYVSTLTRVLIPTVLKLLERISPASLKSDLTTHTKPEPRPEFPEFKRIERPAEESEEEHLPEEPTKPAFDPQITSDMLPEPSASQFIVENIGGLLVPSDTVRIDTDLIRQWAETYEGATVEEVEIETFGGKTAQCKVKPIKDSKYEGKGAVQMPEKIQLVLEVKKGELVKIKPVIE